MGRDWPTLSKWKYSPSLPTWCSAALLIDHAAGRTNKETFSFCTAPWSERTPPPPKTYSNHWNAPFLHLWNEFVCYVALLLNAGTDLDRQRDIEDLRVRRSHSSQDARHFRQVNFLFMGKGVLNLKATQLSSAQKNKQKNPWAFNARNCAYIVHPIDDLLKLSGACHQATASALQRQNFCHMIMSKL